MFRIQSAEQDAAALLDEANWWSYNWNDEWAEPRYGVSVCRTVEDLVAYFQAAGGWCDENSVIVELDGYYSPHQDEDHHLGAILICPTAVLSVTYVTTEFLDLVYA